MEEISWTDRARNEEVSQRVEEERNGLQTIKRRDVNWTDHLLCRGTAFKNTLLKERSREG